MKIKSSNFSSSIRSNINLKKIASGSFSSTGYLSRLASAQSRGSVIALKGNLRREIHKISSGGGDEASKKAAVAKIRNVMKKADEKMIRLNNERRMQERIRQAKYAKKKEEEEILIKKYRSKVYNRKLSESMDVIGAAIAEKERRPEEEYYSSYAGGGSIEISTEVAPMGNIIPSIDFMV